MKLTLFIMKSNGFLCRQEWLVLASAIQLILIIYHQFYPYITIGRKKEGYNNVIGIAKPLKYWDLELQNINIVMNVKSYKI